jgi:hypothetical protein
MTSLPVAMILAQRTAAREARSALPHAAVVPDVDKVAVAPRTRKAVADGLRHLADFVAPPRQTRHAPVHSGMSRQAG